MNFELNLSDNNWIVMDDANPGQSYSINLCGPLVATNAVQGCLSKDPTFEGCQVCMYARGFVQFASLDGKPGCLNIIPSATPLAKYS